MRWKKESCKAGSRKKVTASEKSSKNETKVEEQPASKEETKTVEKVEKPVEQNKKSEMSM